MDKWKVFKRRWPIPKFGTLSRISGRLSIKYGRSYEKYLNSYFNLNIGTWNSVTVADQKLTHFRFHKIYKNVSVFGRIFLLHQQICKYCMIMMNNLLTFFRTCYLQYFPRNWTRTIYFPRNWPRIIYFPRNRPRTIYFPRNCSRAIYSSKNLR